MGAFPYVIAPVNCYATVIALSGFCLVLHMLYAY